MSGVQNEQSVLIHFGLHLTFPGSRVACGGAPGLANPHTVSLFTGIPLSVF